MPLWHLLSSLKAEFLLENRSPSLAGSLGNLTPDHRLLLDDPNEDRLFKAILILPWINGFRSYLWGFHFQLWICKQSNSFKALGFRKGTEYWDCLFLKEDTKIPFSKALAQKCDQPRPKLRGFPPRGTFLVEFQPDLLSLLQNVARPCGQPERVK